ncbi:MAG: hypothetical protein AVDCRST_MAG57-3265, partial [uncultured Blastococcus sp.]
ASRALFGGAPGTGDASIPTVAIPAAETTALTLVDAFVRAGLVASRGEARRLAAQGGLALDAARLDAAALDRPLVDALPDGTGLLRAGKKRYRRVVVG